MNGTWKKTSQNQAEITIDGFTYDGVFVRQWDPTSERYVMTFTAMSTEGVTIWGSRLADRTDEEIVADVVEDLTLGDTANVISNLALPTEGSRRTQISWQTSDSTVVSKRQYNRIEKLYRYRAAIQRGRLQLRCQLVGCSVQGHNG